MSKNLINFAILITLVRNLKNMYLNFTYCIKIIYVSYNNRFYLKYSSSIKFYYMIKIRIYYFLKVFKVEKSRETIQRV